MKSKRVVYNVIQHREWGWLEMRSGDGYVWRARERFSREIIGQGTAVNAAQAEMFAEWAVATCEPPLKYLKIIHEKDVEIARLKKLLEDSEKALREATIIARLRAEDDQVFESLDQKGKRAYRPATQVIFPANEEKKRVPAPESAVVAERVSELREGRNIEIFEDVEAQRAARRGTHPGLMTGDFVDERVQSGT